MLYWFRRWTVIFLFFYLVSEGWVLISSWLLLYVLSLLTFPKECNLLFCIYFFLSLLVFSYFKIKLAHFKDRNCICFCALGPEQYYKDFAVFEKAIIVMLVQVPAIAFVVLLQFCLKYRLNSRCRFVFICIPK